jgi:ubiquinone/menaquinone biosynthesis C-methylase UbiE
MMSAPMWQAWLKLDDFVAGRTGGGGDNNSGVAPWEAAHGVKVFDFLGQHEANSLNFNEYMSTLSGGANNAVLMKIVPWAEYETKRVVDVGGGFGTIARAIKTSFPKIDMHSLDHLGKVEQDHEVNLVAGDMFDASTYPKGISAVLLKHVLHDWDDEPCRQILRACHEALPDDGKVLVVDAVLPNPGELTDTRAAVQYHVDVLMMLFAGKERTKRQWSDLAASAGFAVESFRTDGPLPNLMLTTLVKA